MTCCIVARASRCAGKRRLPAPVDHTSPRRQGEDSRCAAATPTSCHRPEGKVRECCSRVADGQEWKSQGSKAGDLEKEAFIACARSFCRKTTCPMAITMGRIPVALKAEAQDEIVEEKKSMLSEIKRFSRETVSKMILDEREMDNPDGC